MLTSWSAATGNGKFQKRGSQGEKERLHIGTAGRKRMGERVRKSGRISRLARDELACSSG